MTRLPPSSVPTDRCGLGGSWARGGNIIDPLELERVVLADRPAP